MVLVGETASARRVLYFHHRTETDGRGLIDVLDHIDRRRYSVWVVVSGEGTLQEELERRGTPVTVVPHERVPRVRRYTALAQPGEVSRGRAVIARVEPHLVHIDSTALELIYAGVASRLCAVPVIWHVREVRARNARSEMVAKLIRGCAARLVPVSRAASAWLGTPLNGQMVIIPESIDTDLFSLGTSSACSVYRELGLSRTLPSVGHIGLMVPVRRVKDFIRASAVVHRSVEAQFVIARSDQPQDTTVVRDLRRLAKELGIAHRTRFVPVHTDLTDLIPALDIVVSSSTSQCSTRTLLKAAACGKPIIATRTGGVPQGVVHERTGLVVEPGDVDGLAGAILTLIDNRDLAVRMGSSGRAYVTEHFSTRHIAHRIQTLYDEVIEETAARRYLHTGLVRSQPDRRRRPALTPAKCVVPPLS